MAPAALDEFILSLKYDYGMTESKGNLSAVDSCRPVALPLINRYKALSGRFLPSIFPFRRPQTKQASFLGMEQKCLLFSSAEGQIDADKRRFEFKEAHVHFGHGRYFQHSLSFSRMKKHPKFLQNAFGALFV